jgi:hypothetical protein
VRGSLASNQTDSIRGRGFVYGNPIIPSVGPSPDPIPDGGSIRERDLGQSAPVVADATITDDIHAGRGRCAVVPRISWVSAPAWLVF